MKKESELDQPTTRFIQITLSLIIIAIVIFFYQALHTNSQNPTEVATLPLVVAQSISPQVPAQEIKTSQDSLAMKQKCSSDGQKYFNDVVLPQGSPEEIGRGNQLIGQQNMSAWRKNLTFGNQEFSYSPSLNTCLIYYMETTLMYDNTIITNFYIKDVYTNKAIMSYYEVNGSPQVGRTYADFYDDKSLIMGR